MFVSNNGVANMPIYGWGQGVFRIDEKNGVKDSGNNDVVGFSGADVVTNTPHGLMSRGRVISSQLRTSKVESSAGLAVIASDGGEDQIVTAVSQKSTL